MKLSEHELQNLIREYLARKGWFVLRLNSGMIRTNKDKMVRLAPAGTPDLYALKKGKSIFIEVKAGYNKVTFYQDQMLKLIEDHGAQTIVIRIIPSEVKFTFTAEEIAEELNIRVENLRIILKLFKFRKILGQYR